MRKVAVTSFLLGTLTACIISICVQQLIKPNKPIFDKTVTEIELPDKLLVIGYRNNSGGATTGFTYHYFFTRDENRSQFLITSKPAIVDYKDDSLMITTKGRILSFSNTFLSNEKNHISIMLKSTLKE